MLPTRTGTVQVYDPVTLKRRKLLSYSELGSTTISSIAFSADGKLCLTQGAEPDWCLVLCLVHRESCQGTTAFVCFSTLPCNLLSNSDAGRERSVGLFSTAK